MPAGAGRKAKVTMMKIAAIFSWAVVCFLANGASQAAPKYYPQTVPQVDAKQMHTDGYSRLKISVSLNDSKADADVNVGNVSVCSDTACYRPDMQNKRIGLYNTSNGKAELIYEVLVPVDEIKSIHFDEVTGAKVVVGDMNFSSALKLDSSTAQGGEILVLLKKKQGGSRTIYYPESSAIGFYHPAATSVYYNPAFAATVKLKMDVEWSIVGRALAMPQVFLVSVHDVGDIYPMVDIYPEIRFTGKSSIRANPLRNASDLSAPNGQNSAAEPARQSVRKTGVIRFDEGEDEKTSQEGSATTSASAGAADCVAFINQYLSTIAASMATTGAVYFKKCETVPPYVHIAIGNNSDGRVMTGIAYDVLNSSGLLSLQQIETLATSSQIAINGFAWVGDRGTSPGTGLAKGFVQRDSRVLGSNRENGGLSGGPGLNQLAVLVQPRSLPKWKESVNGPLWNTGVDGVQPPYSVVSSSTSVIKNGVCPNDSESEIARWSAFGTTPDNKVIFMSSTSSGVTSAPELCEVFRALGANHAIRLDGNSAAGMTIDGKRVNPLVGKDTILYQTSRYVAYGVGMSFVVGTAPATPVVGGRVATPKDPCKVDPTRCQ